MIVASIVALAAGYAMLDAMVSTSTDWLKLALGLVIIISSIQLAMQPALLKIRSSTGSFVFFGAAAGLMGNCFRPPLVYHFYRQPLSAAKIRETLVAIFAVNAVIRLAMVAAAGDMPHSGFWWAALRPRRHGDDLRGQTMAAAFVGIVDPSHGFRPFSFVRPLAGRARLPEDHRRFCTMTTHRTLALKDPALLTDKAFVAGEWIVAPDGKTFPVTDPFDGTLIAAVPDLGPEVVRQAIDAAEEAQVLWARRTAKERAQVLKRWYDLIVANADDLALILTTEQGKPLAEAKGEVIRMPPISNGSRKKQSASMATSSRVRMPGNASWC